MIRLIADGNEEIGGSGGGGGLPDLTTGVEADTGRTINGNTVYERYINFGSLPNNGNKSVAHNITGLQDVIALEFIADNGTTQQLMNWAATSTFSLILANQSVVQIQNTTNFSSYSGRVLISYTRS